MCSMCFMTVGEECLHRTGAVGILYFSFSFILTWRISGAVVLWGMS